MLEHDTAPASVLTLPGIGNSGARHWQTQWELRDPSIRRVQQRDWETPDCEEWLSALELAVSNVAAPVVLVAHSLGCLLLAHWAARTRCSVHGAMLVAPPDPSGPNFPRHARSFAAVPARALSFPSVVVASRDDPYATIGYAHRRARVWGSRFVDVCALGHVNADSGLETWPQGWILLRGLRARRDAEQYK